MKNNNMNEINEINEDIIKTEMNFSIISGDSPNRAKNDPISYKISNKQYILWGIDNAYPNYLYNLYLNCADLQGIIETVCAYTYGEGLITNKTIINTSGDLLTDLIEKIIFDYILYGNFAIHIIKNRLGQIIELYHYPVQRIRINEEETIAYISKDWTRWGSNTKCIKMPLYNKNLNDNLESLFFYKGKRTNETYGVPSYVGSLRAINSLIEVDNYHMKSLFNGFNPSTIITMFGNPSAEQKKDMIKQLNKHSSGSENASKLMLLAAKNKDEAPIISRLENEDFKDRYTSLIDSSKESLYSAFRISPVLIGSTLLSTGFNAIEFKSAFTLYQKTVISPIQKELERVINDLLGDNTIEFKPFDTTGFDTNQTGSTVVNNISTLSAEPVNHKLAFENKIVDKLCKMGEDRSKYKIIETKEIDNFEQALDIQMNMLKNNKLEFATVKYSYDVRAGVPPAENGSRDFCQQIVDANKMYTLNEINSLPTDHLEEMGLDADVFKYRGGFYHNPDTDVVTPYCRHTWRSHLVQPVVISPIPDNKNKIK